MHQETPNEDFIIDNYIESKEYQINYNGSPYNILIGKTKDQLIFSSSYFYTNINQTEFNILFKKKFKSINESYDYIINIFDKKKNVEIKYNEKHEILLELIQLNGKKIQLSTRYSQNNMQYIINYLWCKNIKLENDLNHIQEENKNLKNDCINKIKLLEDVNSEIKKYNQQLKEEIDLIKNENKQIKKENNKIKDEYNNILEEIKSIQNKINSYNSNNNNNRIINCFLERYRYGSKDEVDKVLKKTN